MQLGRVCCILISTSTSCIANLLHKVSIYSQYFETVQHSVCARIILMKNSLLPKYFMLSVTLYSASVTAEYVHNTYIYIYIYVYIYTYIRKCIHTFHGSVGVIWAVRCGTSHKYTKYTNLKCEKHFTKIVISITLTHWKIYRV